MVPLTSSQATPVRYSRRGQAGVFSPLPNSLSDRFSKTGGVPENMTKINERRCDVCEKCINDNTHVRLKRTFFRQIRAKLYRWGLSNIAPVESDWVTSGVDICDQCWDDVIDEARKAVHTD